MANPGLPDVDALSSLGGELVNYANVEDPTTDLDAEYDNRSRMQVAMMSHTAIRAWARVTLAATTGAMVLAAHDALWGSDLSVAPALARTSTGLFTLTYPASVNDELARSHTVNFRAAWASTRSVSAAYSIGAYPSAANIVTLNVRLSSTNAQNDAVGVDFDVFVI